MEVTEKIYKLTGFLYSRQMLTLKGYLRLNVAKPLNAFGNSGVGLDMTVQPSFFTELGRKAA